MAEFREIVEGIGSQIKDVVLTRSERALNEGQDPNTAGIKTADFPHIAERTFGQEINCYPGVPGYRCMDISLFFSLKSPGIIRGSRGHLTFREALELLVNHMQGSCQNKTHKAILICDNWDAVAFYKWQANLKNIRNKSVLEIYMIAGGKVNEIDF